MYVYSPKRPPLSFCWTSVKCCKEHSNCAPQSMRTYFEAMFKKQRKLFSGYLGRGDDTVGNPHRAQISQLELFELIPLSKWDIRFPAEQFEAAVSQSTRPSPLFKTTHHTSLKAACKSGFSFTSGFVFTMRVAIVLLFKTCYIYIYRERERCIYIYIYIYYSFCVRLIGSDSKATVQ